MLALSLTLLASLTSLSDAKICMNASIPISISSRQGIFGNIRVPQTPYEVTAIIQAGAVQGANATAQALTGYQTVTGNYSISAQFCMPNQMTSSNPTVQVLTHGIGFDKTYWDLSYDNFSYSYVNVATDQYGYCTLNYDRLGIGNSSHGEPINEIQANLEVAALAQLTNMLRQGTFPGVNKTFEKVVHVGHSFGSAQTYALVNMYPTISDGIVLTGFSSNTSFASLFLLGGNFVQANTNQPFRFGNITIQQVEQMIANTPLLNYVAGLEMATLPPSQDLPDGFLVASNAQAIQAQFFYPGFFDLNLLPLADETKQPVTVGELLSLSSLPMTNAFEGPVLVLTGSKSLKFLRSRQQRLTMLQIMMCHSVAVTAP